MQQQTVRSTAKSFILLFKGKAVLMKGQNPFLKRERKKGKKKVFRDKNFEADAAIASSSSSSSLLTLLMLMLLLMLLLKQTVLLKLCHCRVIFVAAVVIASENVIVSNTDIAW